ncbi:hypothetical protein GOP47_0014559 [Adiantum capillus-veneris]|uniref:Leucine-rich repeat-containing N-terminal plant-type domain-containing protein n=1 Tax=Adiantum capillus-veneris TaxID=13818 RepID=A0A9D4UMG8_ADICA|nr:hypothetical protein GOP47_0014559 [Adiantum capillus-veneris]
MSWRYCWHLHRRVSIATTCRGSATKNGLQDPQGALASWHPSSVTPCIWLHVTCDANNKVHSLDLAQSGLAGSISGSLAALQSLRALSLQDNGLTGSIPPQLTILSNLQILHLSNNDLSGPIPTEFSQRFSIDSFKPGNPGLCGAVLHKSC